MACFTHIAHPSVLGTFVTFTGSRLLESLTVEALTGFFLEMTILHTCCCDMVSIGHFDAKAFLKSHVLAQLVCKFLETHRFRTFFFVRILQTKHKVVRCCML